MTDTVTISEPITSVTVSDSVTSVTISSSTPSYDVTITNGAAFTAALNDLTDVTLTSPSNNQVLAYNSSTSQWINSTAAGGGGSVTSVSVVTTNGISGTVATSTTTPAISLSLGAITPSTINTNSIQFDTEASRSFLLREETQFTGYTPYTLGLSYNDSGADTTSAFILYGGGGDTMDLWVYDGSCWFGNNGSGNAPDTRLYRSAANTLRTDDSFIVDGSLTSSTLAVSSANATISGYLRVGSNTAPNNTVAGDITGVRLSLGNSAFGTDQILRLSSTCVATANGAVTWASFDPTFAPTVNSLADFRTLNFGSRVSTATGITMDTIEGIHVEGARFGASADGLVNSIVGIYSQGVVTDSTATTLISVTSITGLKGAAVGKGSGSGIISSSTAYGVYASLTDSASTLSTSTGAGVLVKNPAASTVATSLFGIDVEAQTRGTTISAGIRVAAPSGATSNYAIQLSDTGGTSAGGITFGTDTTLYRSAADTLKTDDGFIIAGTLQPTTLVSMPTGATGIKLWNTADETTNYEGFSIGWSANLMRLETTKGGTGTGRDLSLRTPSRSFFIDEDGSGGAFFQLGTATSSSVDQVSVAHGLTVSNSSGSPAFLKITPTLNQSSTAGYTALLINPTETATGSGTKRLISAQVGSTDKFFVDNTGAATFSGDVTVPDEAYGVGWNGSLEVPTKNAVYDKIETLSAGFSNSFSTISVSGQSDVVADSSSDTLTLVAGSNITITTDASTDTITITGTGGGSGITRSVNVISTPTTAGSTAATDYVYFVSGTTTLTLPTAVGNTNRYTVKNTGSNTVTIATTSSQTIDGSATASLPVANTSLDLVSDGSNWQVV